MRLAVFSHKPCWESDNSDSGYATDGGFPYQMKAISELFDETTIVVPCARGASVSKREGEIALSGHHLSIKPTTTPGGRGMLRKLSFPLWTLRNTPTIWGAIKRADAVHTPIPGDIGTIGMILAVLLGKPLFVRHCGNWLEPRTRAERFWRWFIERYAGGRNVMFATGDTGKSPSEINPNLRWIFSTSLSEDELSQGTSRLAPDTTTPVRLIIVCRQEKKKGTDSVISALPRLLTTIPKLTLDVVGDGSLLGSLKELAQREGVGDRVVFHGKQNHDAVLNLLRAAHLFVYPTQASEGFPKVVLEALASGLPVVTTRVSVLPMLIGEGGGVLLDDSSPDAVSEAVLLALKDAVAYERMSSQAIETAAKFSLERWRDTIGTALQTAWKRPLQSNG